MVVKNLPAKAGDAGSIPEPGRSPGGGYGSPFHSSRLENPMERGAWRATVRVSDTTEWLSRRAPRGYHLQRPPWAQKTRAEGLGAKQDRPSPEAVFCTERRLSLALDVWGEVERSKEKNWVREQ